MGVAVAGFDADPSEPAREQRVRSTHLVISLFGAGTGSLCQDGMTWDILPGSAVLRLPDRDQVLHLDREPRYAKAWLCLPSHTMPHLIGLGMIDPARPVWQVATPGTAFDAWWRLCDLFTNSSHGSEASLWTAMCGLIAKLAPMPSINDPLECARMLLERECVGGLDLAEVAQRVGLGYHALRRRFTERYGCSPSAYRITARIERACALLSEHNVSEVADQLGYPSPFAFSAQFRKVMGLPPSTYAHHSRDSNAPDV